MFVCVWASRSVARAACPENCANTNREVGREDEGEEERVIEQEANWDIQPAQSETQGAFVERGEISERIREESRRNHKTCFMLATVKENCSAWRGSGKDERWEGKRGEDPHG